ncbi:MAG: DNA repair protein RecO [Microcoleaceae cyanobacterium]
MSQTYSATGINLKGIPLGESDRLLTILTREYGIVRAVAPGARKTRSQLGGRADLFVVNHLLLMRGRSLHKISQAETLKSYSGLSRNLGKLAAGQYLTELVLTQALSDQPQEELFLLLNNHLNRLEGLPNPPGSETCCSILTCLAHGTFHLLALAGLAPQVHLCCLTQRPILPDVQDAYWQIGFSINAGGIVSSFSSHSGQSQNLALESGDSYGSNAAYQPEIKISTRLSGAQVALLQQLTYPELTEALQSGCSLGVQRLNLPAPPALSDWMLIERLLRQYAEYHLGRGIRSALLVDSYVQQSQFARP